MASALSTEGLTGAELSHQSIVRTGESLSLEVNSGGRSHSIAGRVLALHEANPSLIPSTLDGPLSQAWSGF